MRIGPLVGAASGTEASARVASIIEARRTPARADAGTRRSAQDNAILVLMLLALASVVTAAAEMASVPAPAAVTVSAGAGRFITLEAVGPAFRVGISSAGADDGTSTALPTLMLPETRADAPANATIEHWPAAKDLGSGVGLRASFGAIYVANHTTTQETFLVLLGASDREITRGALVEHGQPSMLDTSGRVPSCESAGTPNTDKVDGHRLKASVEDLKSDCCAACTAFAGCTAWIFATDAPAGADNCWLMDAVTKTKPAAGRIFGRTGGSATHRGVQLELSALPSAKSYGFGGADQEPGVDGDPFAATAAQPIVGNRVWRTPSYWATEGYAALGVASTSHAAGNLAGYGASWQRANDSVTWDVEGGRADLYFAPAATLPEGVSAIAQLTGPAAVPPKFAFGFLACRWGWDNRSYIEQTLHKFRDGRFPLDAFISDYGWFTNVPNAPTQDDFGYNPSTFPDPVAQLANYHADLHVKFGGIRKPRIANASMLAEVTASGFLLDGAANNLNFSIELAREWYAQKQAHYLRAGVDFWWNDEGETQYETYHLWNIAHQVALTAHDPTRRLFTLNRAFTPGIGRMGVGIWTGDISVSWEAFQRTPATILRWGLAGAFFVACDTGGFEGSASPPDLLARWYQLSSVLPIMRVHSRVQNPPHWPWLYGSAAEQTMRAALTLRYALLPMVYSLAHHAREVGAPLVRPLMYEFPNQEQLAHVSDQFTLGTSLLAAPVLEQNATTRTVVLPRLDTDTTVDAQAEMSPAWFVFNSTTTHAGQQNLSLSGLTLRDFPLFVRGGSILALAPVGAQYVAESHTMGPLEVHVYSGANANFVLVEDDGETTGYATAAATDHLSLRQADADAERVRAQAVKRTVLSWNDPSRTLEWKSTGGYAGKAAFKQLKVVLWVPRAPAAVVTAAVEIGTGGKLSL